jgi:thiamine-phosphate pyrophosphorylase
MVASRKFPPLYPILDAAFLPKAQRSETLTQLIASLAEAGVEILQYRNKQGIEAEILRDAETMRAAVPHSVKLIMNDYSHLAVQVGFDGVHLGQHDMPPQEARALLGPNSILGLSTHNEAQLRSAQLEPVDYIAIGPVFATLSKLNPDPVIGIDGIRLAQRLTDRPVIAIGGITVENAPLAWDAGADSVAVISAIFSPGREPAKSAADFLRSYR